MKRAPREPLARRRVSVALVVFMAPAGCIADIREERVYGAPRPVAGYSVELERSGDPDECRQVAVTPMVRDVVTRRSFADVSAFGPQATNAGLMLLLGAAAGFIGYDLSALACVQNSNTGCSGQTQAGAVSGETLTLGLAAVPLAFLVYNAVRVQDRTAVERLPPVVEASEWGSCPK